MTDAWGKTHQETLTINITDENDAPTVTGPVTLIASNEDALRLITITELTASASDQDGDALGIENLIVSSGGLVKNLDGTWTYKPAANDDTGVTFTYDVIDGNGGSISTTATLDLLPVSDASPNTAPSFTGPNQWSVGENQFFIAPLAASDPDGDALSYTIAGGDDAALFSIDAKTGMLSFVHAPDFEAPGSAAGSNEYQVRVEVSDGSRDVSNLFHVSVTDSDDENVGTAGNDVFHAGAAFEHFHGDAGRDTVVFTGARDAYTIEVQSDGTVTVAYGNGIDTLESIERLQFDDGTLAFDADGNAGQMLRLYQAAFGREPDAEGLGYWVRHQDAGQSSFQDVARSFMASPEFAQNYGSEGSLSNSAFINLLYENVLGREPDADGFAYWTNKLDTGQTNHGDLLAFFSDSNENIAGTADAVSHGIWFV
ncbi:DUF4214 domain-containing protein [Mesorhizobium sp. A556]